MYYDYKDTFFPRTIKINLCIFFISEEIHYFCTGFYQRVTQKNAKLPMAEHYDLGKWGEEQAALYLKNKGWFIRDRDWHDQHRDLDIVAIDQDSSILLVVEVKTRSSERWGNPDDAIDFEKQNNILRATAAYARCHRLDYCQIRYDTISVIGTPDTDVHIIHKENAFDISSHFQYQEQRRWQRRKKPGTW